MLIRLKNRFNKSYFLRIKMKQTEIANKKYIEIANY